MSLVKLNGRIRREHTLGPHMRQRLKKEVLNRTGVVPVLLGQLILFLKHL